MLQTLLNSEEVVYTTTLSTSQLKEKLEKIFRPKTTGSRYYLPGEFDSERSFKASSFSKFSEIGQLFKGYPAHLSGQIIEKVNSLEIHVTYRPNLWHIFSPFLFPLFGIMGFFGLWGEGDFLGKLLGIWFILCGFGFYAWGRYLRNGLKKRFESLSGLESLY